MIALLQCGEHSMVTVHVIHTCSCVQTPLLTVDHHCTKPPLAAHMHSWHDHDCTCSWCSSLLPHPPNLKPPDMDALLLLRPHLQGQLLVLISPNTIQLHVCPLHLLLLTPIQLLLPLL